MLSALTAAFLRAARPHERPMQALLGAGSRASLCQLDAYASPLMPPATSVTCLGGSQLKVCCAFIASRSDRPLDSKCRDRPATDHYGTVSSTPPHRRLISPTVAVTASRTAQQPGPSEQLADSSEPVTIALPQYCSGCGVKLQTADPAVPGYARIPRHLTVVATEEAGSDDEAGLDPSSSPPASSSSQADRSIEPTAETNKRAAFDSLIESWADEDKPQRRQLVFYQPVDDGRPNIVCARCFSLSHYGTPKRKEVEQDLPAFDLAHKVGRKIAFQKTRAAVILCVVDVADFDGSLPRQAIQALLPQISAPAPTNSYSYRRDQQQQPNWSLVIAANKADLLPAQAKPLRLEAWVRQRAAQAGLPRPSAVHLVSSAKGQGVRELLTELHDAVGIHGDVWVVGAQNAGKSSLINAMHRAAHKTPSNKPLTIANLPGTTLGVLRVDGLMPPRCRMFDTPGVPHNHQLASVLTAEEVALLHPKRRLQARTYRVAAGNTLLVGGVARIDVLETPGATIYLTVFAASAIACHMSKTDNVSERYERLAGRELAPPSGDAERLKQWPGLLPCELSLAGRSWKNSSTDIAIAGLGWIAVGVQGMTELRAWAPPGIAVTTRAALIPDFNTSLERPGLGLRDKPKAGQQLLQQRDV